MSIRTSGGRKICFRICPSFIASISWTKGCTCLEADTRTPPIAGPEPTSRIAVLKNGRLQQHATPRAIYEKPANQFVAYFVGSPSMNFFDGSIKRDECGLKFLSADFSYSIPGHLSQALDRLPPVENVTLGIRPEHIRVTRQVAASPAMQGIVDVLEPIGRELHVELILGETSIVAITPLSLDLRVGERVSLQFDNQWCHLFHRESSVNLLASSAH